MRQTQRGLLLSKGSPHRGYFLHDPIVVLTVSWYNFENWPWKDTWDPLEKY